MPQPRRVALMLDLEWPYKRHSGIFAGTQHYGKQRGWHSTVDEFVDATLSANRPKAVPYDGIIARVTKPLADRAARLGVPVVNVWLSSPVWKSVPGVFPDYASAGRLRAEHLLARGLRRFATLVSRRNRAHELESEEFRRVVGAAGYSCAVAKVPLTSSKNLAQWQKTVHVAGAWMDQWQLPIGVYVGADTMGRYVAQVCEERGWRVPQDVAIIAGLNEETICEHLRPSLTSVDMGHKQVGYEAARLLDRLMDEKDQRKAAQPEHILLPPQGIVVRESTDFFAVDDSEVASAMEFIAANCHRQLSSADVAQAVSMGPRTLHRRFQKVLDRSIAAEIRRVRIERAKRELSQSDQSIAAIARDVGFGERMRMYEVFRRELGVTPSEYRKQRQLENGT